MSDHAATHECVFMEEETPEGVLILGPCLTCSLPAMDALKQIHGTLLRASHEVEWWRNFSLKFMPGNLPRVNSALLGHRFVLMVDSPSGELVRWEHR